MTASIRPRLFSRGNHSIPARLTHKGDRFNSATALQPWKRCEPQVPRPLARRASIRPRLFSRGNLNRGLQAGGQGALQFGHGSSAVETLHCRNRAGAPFGLQFGHGSSAVETRTLAHTLRTLCARFNSATALQPWKLGIPAPDLAQMIAASIRPRLFSRGNASKLTVHRIKKFASIRPRLFSRGNPYRAGRRGFAPRRFNSATALQPWKLRA